MVETDGLDAVGFPDSDFEKHMQAGTPLGGVAEPEDIATPPVFFASADAGWVTGQTLMLSDGKRSKFAGAWSRAALATALFSFEFR
jgi:3-oxoacyl-[acyl-carrier protein] reductase